MVLPCLFNDLQRGRHHFDGPALGPHRQPGAPERGLSRRYAGEGSSSTQTPDIGAIRQATEAAGIKDASVVIYDVPSNNEVLISLPEQTNENALDQGRQQIVDALNAHYGNAFTMRQCRSGGSHGGQAT